MEPAAARFRKKNGSQDQAGIPRGERFGDVVLAGTLSGLEGKLGLQADWDCTTKPESTEAARKAHGARLDWLTNGAVVSSHEARFPTLAATTAWRSTDVTALCWPSGEDSPQLGTVELLGAQRGNTLAPLSVPSRFNIAPPGTPAGEAVNIGHLYAGFAGGIRNGSSNHPTFATAIAMHRVIDCQSEPKLPNLCPTPAAWR